MLPTSVHEHVSEQLIDMKVRSHEEVKPQHIVQIDARYLLSHEEGDECQEVDDKQILGNCWNFRHIFVVSL